MMITHKEALDIILSNVQSLEQETIGLSEAVGRVLSKDIFSDIDMPPFRKSAVDGYACRLDDIEQPLKIIEIIKAGDQPRLNITPGTCSKIMTGAVVPDNADVIIMVEDTILLGSDIIRITPQKQGTNICLKGEDISKGEKVLRQGTLLKPHHVGVLATVGVSKVPVYRKVRIGIITTGSELQEPYEQLKPGKIRNSNGYQLFSSCQLLPVLPQSYGIIPDVPEVTISTLEIALQENDIVLMTGGVSAGDFDFVPEALKHIGLEILFDRVAMQPGRPLTFARKQNLFCFGLPGNPVSSLIQFELSVKPLIYKLSGHNFVETILPLKLGSEITRQKANRQSFYPVKLNSNNEAVAVPYHGSAHINAFSEAFGLISLDHGVYNIQQGETVHVRLL